VTEDRERLGARLLAFAGLWLLLSGLLLVLSLVVVAFVSFAALFLFLLAVGGRFAARHFKAGEAITHGLVATTDAAARGGRQLRGLGIRQRARRLGTPGGRRVKRLGSHARVRVARAPGRGAELLASALQAYARAVYRLNAVGRRRRAVQLNELGAQLRRQGDPVHAAEQHRVALEIVRDLGDEQAEALTLNSLALALAQGGAEEEAVEHFEQARDVLHALGDEEHEGQVIANLGLVYRRQGESEQASVLFQEALDRLPPESRAYRHVMEELLRAS
jgi:tetratricopeptide (TPR) repeat protein